MSLEKEIVSLTSQVKEWETKAGKLEEENQQASAILKEVLHIIKIRREQEGQTVVVD